MSYSLLCLFVTYRQYSYIKPCLFTWLVGESKGSENHVKTVSAIYLNNDNVTKPYVTVSVSVNNEIM